jgi:hypothetical protein
MQNASRILAFIGEPLRSIFAVSLILTLICFGASAFANAQEAAQGTEGPAAAVAPIVPQQVRYAGKLATRTGETVEAEFRIYAAAEGGDPLWTETQRITLAEDGSYSVLLGSASPSGLPQTVFAGGAARWLGVSVERGEDQERVLLSSVPYAMKSADAESLAGHAASDFVTQQELARFALSPIQSGQSSNGVQGVQPDTSGTVTGSGTAGTVPLWTGALTQGNSEIVQVGSDIGINEATPGSTLDVGGTATIRGATTLEGTTTLPPVATATTTTGIRSQLLDLSASAWSSTAAAPVNQTFRIYSNFTGNNTPTPSGTLNFQFQEGTGSVANILSIASNGVISFNSAQTFPGTIKSVSATSPVTAATTAGAVSLGLNTAALETTLNSVYPQLGAANAFTGNQSITGGLTVTGALVGGSSAVTGLSSAAGGFLSNGAVTVKPATLATTTAAVNSPLFEQGASAYSSTSSSAVAQNFAWQAQAAGNNTSAPTANLALLYGSGTGTPAATGLSISPNGNINFSSSQVFPIKGTGGGTITGITTTGPLTGSGTSGSVALGLNTSALETTLNGIYAQLGAANAFTAPQQVNTSAVNTSGVDAVVTGNGSIGIYGESDGAVNGSATPTGVEGLATGTEGNGVTADETGPGGYGIYAHASGAQETSGRYAPIGVYALSESGNGVLGINTGSSNTYNAYKTGFSPSVTAGVWGDTSSDGSGFQAGGIVGTADNNSAAFFVNNSTSETTVFASNNSSGGTGLFKAFKASTRAGTCGIGDGDLTCTGQVKTLATTGGGAHTVETYAMQSPENWMEDFGSGELQRGVAVVKIDPAFAETVSDTADYHVFITPNGDSKGLYVINKTATSFEVRESGGGTSSLSFDYRIVAKRRGYEAQRLNDVTERFNAEQAHLKRRMPVTMTTAK